MAKWCMGMWVCTTDIKNALFVRREGIDPAEFLQSSGLDVSSQTEEKLSPFWKPN